MADERKVCVTGAGGFVASWLVKLLLSKGYTVHGTVRDPDDPKNDHLKTLENSENIKLFKADLLDLESLSAAIKGCQGVFHSACPVPSKEIEEPEVEMVRPAVDGTQNVLKACSEAKVTRVVLLSSLFTVFWDPNWPVDKIMDESCWSDKEFMKTNKMTYSLGKTVSEENALEFSKSTGLDVVVVCPSLIIGPMLQPTLNTSSMLLINIIKGKWIQVMQGRILHLVDVRDVADALLIVYETPKASGRYICSPYCVEQVDLIGKRKSFYPTISIPDSSYEENPYYRLTSEKLKKLGWNYMAIEECIRDSVEDYQRKHFLNMN